VNDQTPATAPVTAQDTPGGPGRQPDAPQPPQTAPGGFPDVQGHCPACGGASLFVGSGGYITCRRIECPEPDAATTLLERNPRTTPDNPATSSDAADKSLREQLAMALSTLTALGGAPPARLVPVVRWGAGEVTRIVDWRPLEALLGDLEGAIEAHLDIADAEAWCRTCRRAWDGPRHRCESDGEQQAVQLRATLRQALDAFEAYWSRASYCGPGETAVQPEHLQAWRAVLDGKERS
jgi:hypothetical protein